MPSTSPSQARFMSAAAHNPAFAAKAGIPVSVAKEFHAADAGHKWGGKHKDTAGPKVAAHYKAEYHDHKQGGGETPGGTPSWAAGLMTPSRPAPGIGGVGQAPAMMPGAAGQAQRPGQTGGQAAHPFQMGQMPSAGAQPFHFQLGGDVIGMHKRPGQGAMESMFKGPIKSSIMGRTDKLRMDVKPGSYIMPADIVSGIGQGNTDAGHSMLKALFTPTGLSGTKMAGHGKRSPAMGKMPGMSGPPQMPKHIGAMGTNMTTGFGHPRGGMGMRSPRIAQGGQAHGGTHQPEKPGVPIVAAGGEHVIEPDEIIWKFGDLKRGHDALDHFVRARRALHIKQQAALPPPKKKYGGRVNAA
jgi:hypothetical protein